MSKERQSNFELMRIISIIFIILCHTIGHGNVFNNCQNPSLRILLDIIFFIIIVHVNSFLILTGYFQSNSTFKRKKAFKLIFQSVTYSFVIFTIAVILGLVKNHNIVMFIENALPSSVADYWFISCYLIVYIFSDYLNIFINRISKDEYKKFLLVAFLVLSVLPYITGLKFLNNDGFNFFHFIFLYFIGAYLRKYPLKEMYYFKNLSEKKYRIVMLLLFFLLAFFNFSITEFSFKINGLNSVYSFFANRFINVRLAYSNPIIILQSVCFFEFFRTLKFKNKIINLLSTTVFGIYLFHDNNIVRKYIYKFLKIDNGYFYSYKMVYRIFVGVIIIFTTGFIIEFTRSQLVNLVSKLIKKKRKDADV